MANDISTSRARALLKNLELQGIGNIYVTGEDPAKLAGIWQETFDRVLIDAPCSGEGMFRREPQMMQFWEERPPESYIPVQRSLILQGAEMVKPGGYLLYSTCTFDREEDEGTIRYLLTEREDMELCEIAPYEGFHEGYADADMPELAKCVRIFPHRMDGEGHFLALLRKKEQTPGARDSGKNKASKDRESGRFPKRRANSWLRSAEILTVRGFISRGSSSTICRRDCRCIRVCAICAQGCFWAV